MWQFRKWYSDSDSESEVGFWTEWEPVTERIRHYSNGRDGKIEFRLAAAPCLLCEATAKHDGLCEYHYEASQSTDDPIWNGVWS